MPVVEELPEKQPVPFSAALFAGHYELARQAVTRTGPFRP